jgi:glycosyltransferase involved in cell wall biosynthesis
MNRKKKILFLSEAAYLNTGYAKYSKEVISRIYDTGKYDIAEFSIYGSPTDPRRSGIRWKNYANLPDASNEKQVSAYQSNNINQFGAWRFDRACLDFEPDIVFTIRDFWMDSFIYHSPFRRIFSWAWMPTVDASPQNQEWIDMFSDADYVLTYSDWAKKLLESQGGSTVNTVSTASPSAAPCFVPMNKQEIRNAFNIKQDVNIVGTVMRNQRRKLFPALMKAFGKYLKESGSTNTFLYLHTSYPDAGWNLAELMHENEISSRVLMTYVCEKCHHIEPSFFRDAKKVCGKCGNYTSTPSNVGNGVPDEELAKIYNIFDLYIQCANSEGFGLPQVEAAACGIPIACTNYSAMEDLVNKLEAYPIDYSTYKELETGCDRAVPDIDSIVKILDRFFSSDKPSQRSKGEKTRLLFEKNYSWDKTAETWMTIADECKYADWKQPLRIISPQKIDMKDKSTYNFMQSIINGYSFYDPHKNSHFARCMLTDLKRGLSKSAFDAFYISEFSPFASNKPRPINREIILKLFESRLQNYNIWEETRLDKSRLIDLEEKWLTG